MPRIEFPTKWLCMVVFCSIFAATASASTLEKSVPLDVTVVENEQSESKTVRVATFTHNPTTSIYVVRGKVRYRDVEGIAYLEMWNVFPDGRRYFSRTLGAYLPKQHITGTSGFRDFELPFNLMENKPESVSLEINVVMPGKGKIELSSLTISETGNNFAITVALGGILGGVVGLYGALLGSVAGILIPLGKGRKYVDGLFLFGFIGGAIMLIFGIAAFVFGQPYGVYFPLTFIGVDLMILLPILYYTAIKKAYEQVELRKMQAMDV